MRKRTLVSLLFYFFICTKARKVRESNKTLSSVGDFIADMVRTFALSGQNGPLGSKLDKDKVGRSPYGNVFSSILMRMFLGDDKGNLAPNINFDDKLCRITFQFMVFPKVNLSKQCQNAITDMICAPLINATTLTDAVKKLLLHSPVPKMLDAWQKIPERILLGNTQWIGSYDECTNIPEAKYCSSNLMLEGNSFNITYGSCFPKKCSTPEVSEMFHKILTFAQNKIGEKVKIPKITDTRTLCDNEIDFYNTGWQITMGVVAIILFLCTLGTICEYFTAKPRNPPESGKEEHKLECGMNNIAFTSHSQLAIHHSPSTNNIINDDVESSFRSPSKCNDRNNADATPVNHLLEFLMCFSLLKNSKTIFSTQVPEGTIRSINGIRVISFTWIILGNYHLYGVGGLKTDNILYVMKGAVHKFSFLAINNAYVSVDSFFVLSGCLVSYLTLKKFGKNGMRLLDILKSYLHRYVRLTPTLGLVIGMYNFLPQFLRGPMSLNITQTDEMSGGCHNYWWSVIFYFNNFYPSYDKGCLNWTFYLANDMQFFLISPFLVLLMLRIERTTHSRTIAILYNFILLMLLCFSSFLITAIITYKYHLPSIPTSAMLLNSPYTKEQLNNVIDMVYMKPYCRITPYLVGLFLGYLISKDIKPSIKGIGKVITATGWISATVGGLLVVYGPWHIFQENGYFFSDVEVALYAGCHRFVWGCAVAWVIYACHNKCGGIISMILSWKIWIPLSRLTYCSFLMHLEIIYIYTFPKETPIHYQINQTVFIFISTTVLSYAGAFVLAVCVEYPILNLKRLIIS